MKCLNIPEPLSGGTPTKRFAAARAMTSAYALSAAELIGPVGSSISVMRGATR
jgi:hypothetical protein